MDYNSSPVATFWQEVPDLKHIYLKAKAGKHIVVIWILKNGLSLHALCVVLKIKHVKQPYIADICSLISGGQRCESGLSKECFYSA